jgi:hypothetical protein
MTQEFFQIRDEHEGQLKNFVEANGARWVKKSDLKRTAEGEEQYWSVKRGVEEVFEGGGKGSLFAY